MHMQAPRASRPITVLLVDDDPDCRMLIRDVITAAASRAEVCEAADGRQALDFLRRLGAFARSPRPDLIYLDVEMPALSGREVLKAIRSDPALRDIPVVMLTGLDDEEEKQEALRNGAAGYVVKPAEPRRFLAVVTRSVNHWMRRQRGAAGRVLCPADREDVGDD